MFDKFTDRARTIIALAQQEAERFHHDYIGTEHLLLGLVKEGSGVAVTALNNLGIDSDQVSREVEKLVVVNKQEKPRGPLPFTPQAKRALELAAEEARILSHPYVGSEHLLLGLLVEHDSISAQVLIELGLKIDGVRSEILDLLGVPGAERSTPAPRAKLDVVIRSEISEALRSALGMAEGLGRTSTGIVRTDHVLLGLIAERDGRAARALAAAGLDTDRLMQAIADIARDMPDAG